MANRIVVDTNVYLSALAFGGNPRIILEMVCTGAPVAVISEHIYVEMRRVIAQKFPKFAPEHRAFELLLRECAMLVPLGTHTVTVCRDPKDNAILETVIVGQCRSVVTGDADLLSLGEYDGVVMQTPTICIQTLLQ